ncbi:MAG: lysophospholipid acyltransferase family protein [bacterium]
MKLTGLKESIAHAVMTAAGYLPLAATHALGRWLGRAAWRLDKKSRQVALINLKIAYPEASEAWRIATAKKSFLAMGESLLESPRLWRLPVESLNELTLNPEVLDTIKQIFDQGNGLVIATPHQGSWEYQGLISGIHTRMTSLFRPPRMQKVSQLVKQGREHAGATLVPTDASGVKALTKALRNGDCTGILPDQRPAEGGGVEVNFFGHPAYTMMLLPKLIAKRQVPVLLVFAERAAKGKGFTLRVLKGSEGLYAANIEEACQTMNDQLEELIRHCPEQYNWAYKRFRGIKNQSAPY